MNLVGAFIAEGFDPQEFPIGPFQEDKLTYKSNAVVEFETPGQKEGLGTNLPGINLPDLKKNAAPIRGVAILKQPSFDLVLLAARLAPEQRRFTTTIIQQAERESKASER